MNTYRVDRSDSSARVPCGTNSIKYCGEDFNQARRVYAATLPGRDFWNQENERYGVILSVWSPVKNDYVVKCMKGFGS